MVAVTTHLVEQAQSIFADLGYTVSGNGPEFRAERKWRVVRVTALDSPKTPPEDGDLRCFVTPERYASELRRTISRFDPGYDWAIIGVEEAGDGYEVFHPPAETA